MVEWAHHRDLLFSPMDSYQSVKPEGKVPLPLEFYLGTALGFFLASLWLNVSYGWVAGLYPIPVLAMMIVGFIIGKIRQRIQKHAQPQRLKYRRRLFLLLIFPLCALGPYCFMKIYYYVEAISLPVPAGWTRTSVDTTVLGMDNGAGFRIVIEGHDWEKELNFYRQYYESRGWIDQSERWITSKNSDGTAFTFRKKENRGWIYFGIEQRYSYVPFVDKQPRLETGRIVLFHKR